MKFWNRKIEHDVEQTIQPTFVVKLKQDRNKTWIVCELRVQADTIEELRELLEDAVMVADERVYLQNNGGV